MVLEFGSLACPICQQFHEEHLPQLLDLDVKWQYRYNEAFVHRSDALLRLAMLENCAAEQTSFWRVRDWLFDVERQIEGPPADVSEAVARISTALDLNSIALAACMNTVELEDQLGVVAEAAELFGVEIVPTFVVGKLREPGRITGFPIVGLPPVDSFVTLLELAEGI